jgi:hypothetical protein
VKKSYRPFIFILLAFFIAEFVPLKSFSQTLEQHISSDTLKVGDAFTFNIILKKDRSYDEVIYPDSASFAKDIGLRSRKIFRVAGFEDSLQYKLQFWGTSDATLPALPIKLISNGDTTTMYTQPVTIHFQSVLKSKNPTFRPLKPIFAFAAVWWPYLAGFLGLLLLIEIGYLLYKKYWAQREPEIRPEFTAEPFLNPLKELQNNLSRLKDIPLQTNEQFEQFYVDLGDAIRLYFERMYEIPALESTSREIIYDLERKVVDERLINQTRFVLREADMVKFAKFTPTKKHAQKAYHKAEDFLSIARDAHRTRIQQMRRRHAAMVELAREQFQEKEKQEAES